MKVGTKVISPIFFSETIITVIIKSTYIMGTSFTKLRLIFSIKFLSLSTYYFYLCMDSACWSCKSLCWSIRAFHTWCVSAPLHPQKKHPWSASFQRSKRWNMGGAKSGLEGRWKRTNSRCRILWVKSWLASVWTVKESCYWNS